MVWQLEPLVEIPLSEEMPFPADWDDPVQRKRWQNAQAEAFALTADQMVGLSFVGVGSLSQESWRRVVAAVAPDVSEGEHEQAGVDGGLGLMEDGDPLLLPGCCLGLAESFRAWEESMGSPPSGWTMLWVGHPWVQIREVDGDLAISTPSESDEAAPTELLATIPLAALRSALWTPRRSRRARSNLSLTC